MSTNMFSRLRGRFSKAQLNCTETRERRKEGGLSSESDGRRRRWSWGMWKAGRQASSPSTVLSEKQFKKEEERLTTELQLITQERNELRDRLINATEGSMNKRPYHRPNALYEKSKLKEKEIMSFLYNLEMENIEAHEKCQELKKEMNFYRNLHSRLLLEKTLVMKKLVNLKQETKEIQVDWAIIQHYLVGMNLNDKEEQEKTTNLQTQQHQVSETAAELELAPSQEEGLLQHELPPQEPPEELQPQESQNTWDGSSCSEFTAYV